MESVWGSVRENLRAAISENNFKIWIDPLQPLRLGERTLVLGCPNRFFLTWVKENYYRQIVDAARSCVIDTQPVETIELEIAPAAKSRKQAPVHRQQELPQIEVHQRAPLRFNPRFTFDRFVVGSTNEYAYSATKAMANGRELNTNTLFLLSDPGLGKSHLSQALGHCVLGQDQKKKVYYLTAEDFTNELVYSIKNKCVEDFKNKYRRDCDVLVLEEIHFLSGKEKVQAELAYTLDCLLENHKKVVFTSSRLPRDIPRLGRQFASRLSDSLISTIEQPDVDTRYKILEQRVRENRINIPSAVLDFLAKRITRDVRKMESCLNSLNAKSTLLKRPITLSLAQETLGDFIEEIGSDCSLEAIQEHVCRYYQISPEDLKSRSRRKNILLPRNIGMYLARKLTDLSLEAIGKHFDRNHSTVLYSVNAIENNSKRDAKLKGQIEFLMGRLNTAN